MKKILILTSVFILTLCGCVQQNEFSKSALVSSDENEKLVFDRDTIINEQKIVMSLPEQYSSYTKLCDVDDEWYYLSNITDDSYWKFIKVNKNDMSQIIELTSIDKSIDTSLWYAWKGDLYLALLLWEDNSNECLYQIVKLGEDNKIDIIIEGYSSGLPSINVSDRWLIIVESSKDRNQTLFAFDMESQERRIIYESSSVVNEDWSIEGKLICGLEWPRKTFNEEGFCFVVSDMNGRTYNDGQKGMDEVYYYSFKEDTIISLKNNEHTVDYIGGSDKIFFVSDYPSASSSNILNWFYIKDNDDFLKYSLECEGISGIFGCCQLVNNRVLLYSSEGYVLVDVNDMAYTEMNYSVLGKESSQVDLLEYDGIFTGFAYANNAYYFSLVEDEQLIIYEIR